MPIGAYGSRIGDVDNLVRAMTSPNKYMKSEDLQKFS